MIAIISPAKTLDFSIGRTAKTTLPEFINEASQVATTMMQLNPDELGKLMKISPKLAETAASRYAGWEAGKHAAEGKPAIMVYKGDVYQGLGADNFAIAELDYAQEHLRILSGLYGILRPLDLILPYRLEMGTNINVDGEKNLYAFWSQRVTSLLAKSLAESGSNTLINLASDEYSAAIDFKQLGAEVIQPVFKDYKNGQYKVITFFAKKARGMMSRFMIKNNLRSAEDLKLFNHEGYHFNDLSSTEKTWVFTCG